MSIQPDADADVILIEPGVVRRWFWPVLLPLLAGCLLFGTHVLWQRQRFHSQDVILLGSFALGAVLLVLQAVIVTRAASQMPAVTLILSPAGLTLCVAPGPGTIPWPDVEAFGLVRDDWVGQTVGLRLRSYDGFHASLGVEARSMLVPPLAEQRQARGYEVQVPRRVLDGSVDEFLGWLDEYLERYGQPPLAA